MAINCNLNSFSENEIHIWAIDESKIDVSKTKKYCNYLSKNEINKMMKFYFDKDKNQFLTSKVMLRLILSKYDLSIMPHQWRFFENKNGKPFIQNTLQNPIYFNVSHTENIILIAISRYSMIGIDVEYIDNDIEVLDVADKYFTIRETKYINQASFEKRLQIFYKLWTLKEAYIKACGVGLTIPLQQFSFSLFNKDVIEINFAPEIYDDPLLWRFWQFVVNGPYKMALALKIGSPVFNADRALSIRHFVSLTPMDFQEIMRESDRHYFL